MDCLVNLYHLPEVDCNDAKISYRQVMAYEKTQMLDWVKLHFSQRWSDECSAAFNQQPISCFIATENGRIVGFACYDCTQKNFFGPMGIQDEFRQHGIGSNLLVMCLEAMKANGYAYAIIGGCDGQVGFYTKIVSAVPIEGSTPGIYSNPLSD